jgi:hypothetical protein
LREKLNGMKSFTLFISIVTIFFACHKDDEQPSKTQLLTNGSSKVWRLSEEHPEDLACSVSSERVKDNSWVFSNNGNFSYDHGQVTEMANETCSDLINLMGKWVLTENETNLLVTITYSPDKPNVIFNNDTLFFVQIKALTNDALIIHSDGYEATLVPK